MRVDFGAGDCNLPGFVGVDRYPLPGIRVVLDLDRPLPFAANTIDFALAGDSLEHVCDLMATMAEIYRVCRDRAQVCILAPYGHQSLNYANPYHYQHFNEHTPRFWSSMADSPIDRAEYTPDDQDRSPWGLSRSDHSRPNLELQCFKMAFFYFPEFAALSCTEQRTARRRYLNVCKAILYHLVVNKSPISLQELRDLEPAYVPPGARWG